MPLYTIEYSCAAMPKTIADIFLRCAVATLLPGVVGFSYAQTAARRDKFAADGADPAPPASVDEFGRKYLPEVAKWDEFLKKSKLKL